MEKIYDLKLNDEIIGNTKQKVNGISIHLKHC